MPSCRECSYLENSECRAYKIAKANFDRPIPPAPMGGCAVAIVEQYCRLIQPGQKVLEIGCGTWSPIKNHCLKIGAHYEGIDVQEAYYGKPVVATRIENLATLSFDDNTFDFVIGNQTIEHWAQYGCMTSWGLYQCFRVCKPEGFVLLNFPMHYHGTRYFVMGHIDALKKLFSKFSKNFKFEKWGTPSAPFTSWAVYPDFKPLANTHAYHMNVIAQKDIITKIPFIRNLFGFKGWLSQLFQNDFRFNFYRLYKKIRKEKIGLEAPPQR